MNEGSSRTLAKDISDLVQHAADDGRNHLNDDEANQMIQMTEKLVRAYLWELKSHFEY